MKKEKSLEEIEKEIQEPIINGDIEKFATMSDDKKSLILRIPQEIRQKFNLKAGDKLRFNAKFENKKEPRLEITILKC